MPRYDLVDSNRHGTRCAGEVAAEANNSICAVGIAFRAGIGGELLDFESPSKRLLDVQEESERNGRTNAPVNELRAVY